MKWLEIDQNNLHVKFSAFSIERIERRLYLSRSRPFRFKEASAVGRQVRLPPKSSYFTALGRKQLQMDADILLIITSTGDELLNGVNIDDLE